MKDEKGEPMLSYKYYYENISLQNIEQIKKIYNLRDMNAETKKYIYLLTNDYGTPLDKNSYLNKNYTACRYCPKNKILYTDIDLTLRHKDKVLKSFLKGIENDTDRQDS